uniref:Uncharacterized protein n=1 Tax=Picea glauca TaxID=3330 RepID=A0A124GP01_PICGL|nr:hypothetical protein ABT39_MTgene261 [Picea glauca]QHR90577.1 hypothetical protein Q903MT_gene4602 [Picea sitchensis]
MNRQGRYAGAIKWRSGNQDRGYHHTLLVRPLHVYQPIYRLYLIFIIRKYCSKVHTRVAHRNSSGHPELI